MRGSPIRGLSGASPFKTSVILRSERRDFLESSPDRLVTFLLFRILILMTSNIGELKLNKLKLKIISCHKILF
jgi:hypothetical protein